MRIDTRACSFDMTAIQNRRFMYSAQTGELILGRQYKGAQLHKSHAEEHFDSGAEAPFDSFVRGWVGTGPAYPYGVIHFAPNIDTANIPAFETAFAALEMFQANGAAAQTVVRAFGDTWEQPLSDLLPERSERMAEKPIISGYLSNLGKYAEGRPAGEWVGFPTTAEHMKEAFARIGLDFKTYEEWHFTEFQSSVPRLAERLPEHAHPDELNYLSALISTMDGGEREKFAAAAQHGEYAGSLQDLINLAQNLDCYELVPGVLDEGDYGHYLIDELETIKLPEEAKPYFDYEGYGGDTIINQGGELTALGYIYNNRSPFTEHYNGRDVPEEYRVTPQPPEPGREGPDFEASAPAAAPRPVAPILLASDKPGRQNERDPPGGWNRALWTCSRRNATPTICVPCPISMSTA